MQIETFEDLDLTDALVIVAFHGVGAAGPIAGAYLQQQQKLPLVGHLVAEEIGPVVHVDGGLATSPIRVYGGETVCKLDRNCPRLFIIMSELPYPPELATELAQSIMAWAKGAQLVLALDSIARPAGEDVPDVYMVGDSIAALKTMDAAKINPLPGGILAGTTAALASIRGDIPVGAFLVEATEKHPDGRAAAALIEAVDRLIPSVELDADPLLAEALAIEERLQEHVAQAKENKTLRSSHTFI